MDDDPAQESTGITRVAKACDPCRVRKTRCDIATQSVCTECLKRDQALQCVKRDKARPNRPLPRGAAGSGTGMASGTGTGPAAGSSTASSSAPPAKVTYASPQPEAGPSKMPAVLPALSSTLPTALPAQAPYPRPVRIVSAPAVVESMLEEEALGRFDLHLDLALKPETIFDSAQARHSLAEIGLAPRDPSAVTQAHHWINTHFRAIHHNTPFLNLPSVIDTATRVFGPGGDVDHDDLALLYAILALGSLREQTYDSSTGKYRSLRGALDDGVSPASTRSSHFRSRSTAQCLFRLAQDELEQMDQPSEIAVQALFLLHTFISNTSMGRRSRDYVARAIMMAHELGLNRRIPYDLHLSKRVKYDKHAERRRAMVYLYVYFSDVYLSALDSHPPLIKKQDYDADVFDVVYSSSASGVDTPSGTPLNGLRAFVDLVTTIGSILERLHSGTTQPLAVLQLDGEMDQLRERLGSLTFDMDLGDGYSVEALKRTAVAGSVLRQIHYNWSRIALRAPFLRDPLLRHSSLSICARAAMSILQSHRHVVSAAILNLPWMQLRRVTISIYLVFIALWSGEIPHGDAEQAVTSTLEVLCVIGTRWQSAAQVGQIVIQLADKMGLSYKRPVLDQTGSFAEQGIDVLAQLAHVATDQVDPLNWINPAYDPGANPMSQFLDMETIRRFNAELAGMGGEADDPLGSWQALHQPPW